MHIRISKHKLTDVDLLNTHGHGEIVLNTPIFSSTDYIHGFSFNFLYMSLTTGLNRLFNHVCLWVWFSCPMDIGACVTWFLVNFFHSITLLFLTN